MNDPLIIDDRPIILVESAERLEDLILAAGRDDVIGVDLEADSLHHYRDRICLIQVSTTFNDWVVDPIKIKDLQPLWETFKDPAKLKIFHGADFDLRSLDRDYSVHVASIFDTKIALELLGCSVIALAGVLQERFNVSLSKKFQKHNWSRRPLSREAQIYAAMDTRYLIRLYSLLDQELLRRERRDWARQEFEHLEDIRCAPSKRETLGYRRLITGDNPDPRYMQCLRLLFEFRKREAERCDLPVFRIFTDAVLSALAYVSLVKNSTTLDSSILLVAEPYRREVKDIIFSAIRTPLIECPQPVDESLNQDPPYDNRFFRGLQLSRDRAAEKLKIEPSVIAGNKILKRIASLSIDQRRNCSIARELTAIRDWQWDLLMGGDNPEDVSD